MALIIGVVLFIVFLLMGVPIGYGMFATTLFGMAFVSNVELITVTQKMLSGLDSFTLLAVPMFIMAANLMNIGNISQQLVDLCVAVLGRFKGGTAYANVLVSMIFAGISGSSQADTAGIGKILIPGMVEEGYDKETAVGVTISSSTLGVIIPPSIPFVTYGVLTGCSISTLFMAGFVPGILMGLALMVVVVIISMKKGYKDTTKFSGREILKFFWDALLAMLMPVIVLGGIYTGLFTPTEAAVVAVMYGVVVGMFVYRNITPKSLMKILKDAAGSTAQVMILICAASLFGYVLTAHRIPDAIATFILGLSSNKWVILLLINLLLLIVGTFLDTTAAIIILVPILYPIITTIGVDPIHFGMILCVNLAVGFVTPPFGTCLFVACGVADTSLGAITKKILPFIAALLVVVAMVTIFEPISLFLPRLFGAI